MIRANVRSRLREADLRLALLLLAGGDARCRRLLAARLAAEGPGALLDDPRLAARLLEVRTMLAPSPVLFTYVLVRRHLLDGGFASEELADYLAALLLDFGARDRARRVEPHDDDPREYLVDLLAELERVRGERWFRVSAHLGNYALWLGGLYPDRVAARHTRRGGPDLGYYDAMGRRGYALAGGHALATQAGLDGIYATAADRFPALRATLNRLSDRVFFPHVVTHDRVLRELGRDA